MKKILLITDGIFHPPFFGRKRLHKILYREKEYHFKHLRSMEKLTANLGDFSACVIYIHHEKISDRAVAAFEKYVSAGGGVLAIHSATASSKENDVFTEVLGGKFIGHGPVEPFDITPVSPQGGIFSGIPEFRVIDELYLHDLQPDIEVHFTTLYEGQPVPMVWTRTHGKGRVCYACPGHTTGSMRNPEYQKILLRGLAWASAMSCIGV